MSDKIPVSVLVVTKNEEKNLARCLSSLERFDDVMVIDSCSTDATADIAKSFNVPVINFVWNGQYPKKRQWCLDTLPLKHDFVFFIDADETAPPELCDEIAALDFRAPGYFIKGLYVIGGQVLKYGINNNKLCLIDKTRVCFPVVDDLDIPGMGEIEGHYQPVLKAGASGKFIKLKHAMLHYALDDAERHEKRHKDYAQWRSGMLVKDAFPDDPRLMTGILKWIFENLPCRKAFFFIYFYVFKLGFLDYRKSSVIYKSKLIYIKP